MGIAYQFNSSKLDTGTGCALPRSVCMLCATRLALKSSNNKNENYNDTTGLCRFIEDQVFAHAGAHTWQHVFVPGRVF